MTALDFQVNNTELKVEYDEKNPDIAKVYLPKTLRSGEKVDISTPFRVKIPETFSRLGHVGQSYQITQWYPKPAVYDQTGWHPMPYLDQGEFYSEYGSFDVSISLPNNYVVGATGDLQTESERQFLNNLAAKTAANWEESCPSEIDISGALGMLGGGGGIGEPDFPTSATERKTIRFTQNNIHDFAWFADKRFHILKDTAILASGKQVDLLGNVHRPRMWVVETRGGICEKCGGILLKIRG